MPYYPPPSAGGSGLATTGGTMTGTITSTLGTITTADKPFLSGTATWNDAGVDFTGIYLDITYTVANSAYPIYVKVGGSRMFSVSRTGRVDASELVPFGMFDSGNNVQIGYGTGIAISSDVGITFNSTTTADGGANDTGIRRNAAGVVEVNNGTSGTFRDILVRSAIIDGAPSTAGAGQVAIGADTRTTIGANGGASALTALPVGYIDINVGGTGYQIPYYSRGA